MGWPRLKTKRGGAKKEKQSSCAHLVVATDRRAGSVYHPECMYGRLDRDSWADTVALVVPLKVRLQKRILKEGATTCACHPEMPKPD